MAIPAYRLNLSPSRPHRRLMKNAKLELAYDAKKFPDLNDWRHTLHKKLTELTGFGRIKPAEELNVRSLWKQADDEPGTIEKIVFTSEPNADVAAYMCLPKEAGPPYTCFVCVQGHNTGMHVSIARQYDDETRSAPVEGDRDFALQCMRRGIAALCIEQRAFGYRKEEDQELRAAGTCQDAAMHALMLGRSLIAERVFDVGQGIRYLQSRGDIDMERIGVTGNSGGGTTSLFASALVPELVYSMPSCYFCTFKASIMSIGHCVCNYIPRMLDYAEMSDILGLFAPRPVVVIAGKEDEIFPIEGVYEGFENLKAIYRAAGAEDNCTLVVGDGGHRYYAEQGWTAMERYLGR